MKNRYILRSLKRSTFPLIPHPSSLILLTAALLLSGCGFHLRGQATLPFETLFVNGPPAFATQIARAVRAGSKTRVTTDSRDAEATLEILDEARERSILSLSSTGRVQELQIRYRFTFRVYGKEGREYIGRSEIVLKRDLSYSDSDVLGKEQEEALLYRDMQSDAVQRILRRLEAARPATDAKGST